MKRWSWRTPKSAVQVLRHYGTLDRKVFPAGTMWAVGTNNGTSRVYYWIPDGTEYQAKALAKREIDVIAMKPIHA